MKNDQWPWRHVTRRWTNHERAGRLSGWPHVDSSMPLSNRRKVMTASRLISDLNAPVRVYSSSRPAPRLKKPSCSSTAASPTTSAWSISYGWENKHYTVRQMASANQTDEAENIRYRIYYHMGIPKRPSSIAVQLKARPAAISRCPNTACMDVTRNYAPPIAEVTGIPVP